MADMHPTSPAVLDDFFGDALPNLDDLDPSTQGGFRVAYAKEAPLEMRMQMSDAAPAEAGTLEAILCKVAVREGDDGRLKQVKVELSSEADLFFHYTHIVDDKAFAAMRDEQKLMIDFPSYANVLAASFNNAIKEPHTFLAVFVMNRDGQARLDFIQNVSFKFVELLSVNFARSSDDVVRQQIAFRYNSVKSRFAVLQARTQEVLSIVKVKNPSLLLQLQKPIGVPPTLSTSMSATTTGVGGGGAGSMGGHGHSAPSSMRGAASSTRG